MTLEKSGKVNLLHYSAPPVIGGVESVILTHARLFVKTRYPTVVLAGRGEKDALPPGTDFVPIPEMDSQHPQILEITRQLDQGNIPANFEDMVTQLTEKLSRALNTNDHLIAHNIFTKHFNLPLTTALFRLLDQGMIRHCIAWCHDITWTSPNSRSKVYSRYPWDLLRTYRSDVTYVTISRNRQQELAHLFECDSEQIRVIYNGVDPHKWLGLSGPGLALINRLDLWDSDLNLLMPVRITQAKNMELGLGVISTLKKRGLRPKLVVTGPPDPHDESNMEYFLNLLKLREQLGVEAEVRFVYESGSSSSEPLIIDDSLVAELLRASDALFMPSHREGFGMPVLEAGMAGIPIFCSDQVPAANEIGGPDVIRFSPKASTDRVADLILEWAGPSSVLRLRRRIRQNLTWQSIFQQEILPLMDQCK
jgi:glycosyltransferase involved in cell wall biosynthesis